MYGDEVYDKVARPDQHFSSKQDIIYHCCGACQVSTNLLFSAGDATWLAPEDGGHLCLQATVLISLHAATKGCRLTHRKPPRSGKIFKTQKVAGDKVAAGCQLTRLVCFVTCSP
jgi:hypothetical protein